MIILVYFDWTATSKELKKWNQKFSEACEKHGMKFNGLFGPMGQKYNYTWMIETDSADKFIQATMAVRRPSAMTHYITEILIPQKFDE